MWKRRLLLLVALVSAAVGCKEILGIEVLPGGDSGDGGVDSGADASLPIDSSATDASDGGEPDVRDSAAADAPESGAESDGGGDGGGSDAGCGGGMTPCSCLTGGAGLTNCGPNQESCCTSPSVDGGAFVRGYDGVTYTDASAPATVSPFRLDKYEVTVGRFRQFVSAVVSGGWVPAAGAGKHAYLNGGQGLNVTSGGYEPGWDAADDVEVRSLPNGLSCDATYETWTTSPASNENLPITCETWSQAYAFCIWDGGFLPSQAESNFAAAGGGGSSGQRAYPWSVPSTDTTISCAQANYDPGFACVSGPVNAVGSESPAGDGAFGQADLAGNVWEWSLDSWANYVTPCIDCTYLTEGTFPLRVIRGGAHDDNAAGVLVSYSFGFAPTQASATFGVRCARAP
jgi:sulfatase modifying factor 1